jgi:hypothetical protein
MRTSKISGQWLVIGGQSGPKPRKVYPIMAKEIKIS